MNNNKLGLKIVRINQGHTDLVEINGDQVWTKNIWDIRKDLENIDNLDGSSAVLMLTSVDTGHILTIASLIEGRISDCISAWIYVPASINITGKKLVEIVEVVKQEILSNIRNDERLTLLFSEQYDAAPATKIIAKSRGEKCAFRYYGQGAKYTLSELLNEMCQAYYKDYKCVFLMDKSSKMRCLVWDDLSDEKVRAMVLVKSPGKVDSFVPYIGNDPFVGEMYATEESIITIVWKREGYESIDINTTITTGVTLSVPNYNQYVRVLDYNHIIVVDEKNNMVDDYSLTINCKYYPKNRKISIEETKLKNAIVKIEAVGFETITKKNVDLTKSQKFQLKQEEYTYTFLLPLKDQKKAHIEISSTNKMTDSPVEGYELKGDISSSRNNRLIFNPFNRKIRVICLICSLIVLSLGFCCGYALGHYVRGKSKEEVAPQKGKLQKESSKSRPTSSTTDKQTTNSSSKQLEDAISYLDSNNKWNRTVMQQHKPLEGLWDALNYRNFEDILKCEKKLQKSKNFTKLIAAIKNNKKTFNGAYCNEGDTIITIDTYISKLRSTDQPKISEQNSKNHDDTGNQDDW